MVNLTFISAFAGSDSRTSMIETDLSVSMKIPPSAFVVIDTPGFSVTGT